MPGIYVKDDRRKSVNLEDVEVGDIIVTADEEMFMVFKGSILVDFSYGLLRITHDVSVVMVTDDDLIELITEFHIERKIVDIVHNDRITLNLY
ncbi:hypothetical protein MKY96_32760 [Paenibacillus sp. FSL R7-0302]|uniref:hypothetical protein n=1 Tax=Paenibacillus sp. FSL R7-0302 TaxID=2921681 RepID=UPI0030F5A2AB